MVVKNVLKFSNVREEEMKCGTLTHFTLEIFNFYYFNLNDKSVCPIWFCMLVTTMIKLTFVKVNITRPTYDNIYLLDSVKSTPSSLKLRLVM